ncbi:M20/M25/M40 family metallo-hydrolase [Streptomyces sp. BH106]|uniref:M20/M25/M40 family metallo-hydrolase n=1 Tax=Streptomyces sp. BH106 TaxID=3410409 RepID=UPI003CEDC812
MSRATDTVLKGLEEIRPWVEDLYKDLHTHPEPGLREHRTAAKAAEATGLPYASTATAQNADGTSVPVMHACGHDVHVASMLGFARLMARSPDAWHGTVVVLFQPAMAVVRLQTVVSCELGAATPAVLTVGSITAGTGPHIIPDRAVLQLNVRTYDDDTRAEVRAAVERIVRAEAAASGATRDPEFETLAAFPPTVNDEAPTGTVAAAFTEHFGERAHTIERQTAGEDMSRIPEAFGVPFTYWGIGGTDPAAYEKAAAAGRLTSDIPVNHSPHFAPVLQPTLDTGVRALTAAALAWLAVPEG